VRLDAKHWPELAIALVIGAENAPAGYPGRAASVPEVDPNDCEQMD